MSTASRDTETVSGRTYRRTRPRGFVVWSPSPRSAALVAQVAEVLVEYRAHLPLTARQIFYRLVGAYAYDKTERAYARLQELLTRARRARLIPMEAIRDDGAAAFEPLGYADPAAFVEHVRELAAAYVRSLDQGQPVAVEVWVEAAGMAPLVARVVHGYGASVHSCGGFDSLSAKHAAAVRIASRPVPTVVLHVGDHDPSGLSILDAAAQDVAAFAAALGGPVPTFARVAVTEDQVQRYALPTAPQKRTDRRGAPMSATVQAEALAPDQLAVELHAALAERVDADRLAAVREQADAERAALLGRLARLEP